MKSNALCNKKNEVEYKNICSKSKKYCIVHIASECAPFSKRGGLGDVVGSLPKYIHETAGNPNIVFTPYYSNMKYNFELVFEGQFDFNGIIYEYRVLGIDDGKVKYYFIDAEDTYSFDNVYIDGNKPYQADVGLHYFVLTKCIIYFLREMKIKIQSILTHDWHSAGVYPYIRILEQAQFSKINTIHIIHNYHYQGELFYDLAQYVEKELEEIILKQYEKIGYCSMNSIAIMEAKYVITVSPSYAEELNKKIAPHTGLKILDLRKDKVRGIINGIDCKVWNPENDNYIVKSFTHQTIENKYINKKHIVNKFNFKFDTNKPLIAYISRLTPQKGIDLFLEMKTGISIDIYERMQRILDTGINLVICGVPSGGLSGTINTQFCKLEDKFNSSFRYINYYTEEIAHQLFAGSDMFLQPSRFEPCGLTPMYAMKYGSIPIVTKVGGLKDTVQDIVLDSANGNGFFIKEYSFYALEETIINAVNTYKNKQIWRELIERCMKKNFSWNKSIESYLKLIEACD